MIEITHNAAEGTVVWGLSRDDLSAEILKAAEWHWSARLEAWCLPGSRHQVVRMSPVDAIKAALQEAGFEVSVQFESQVDAEPVQPRYSLKWVDRRIARLEAGMRRIDRELGGYVQIARTSDEPTSVVADLWAIGMLLRRIEVDERLRDWRETRDRLMRGAGQHRKVARANEMSDMVETDPAGEVNAPQP